ncbi:MAG: hypothetical protein IKF39_04275 [Oscillospiraceae bacterium]|nr:hypothetical protein [Oscillospiraceae bacterium]
MFRFGEKHPVLFEIILMLVAFLAAALITSGTGSFFMDADISASIARIAVGVLLAAEAVYAFMLMGKRSDNIPA